MELKPGSKLGPYEIVSPLGAGGMGEVWKARDPRLGRDVAIKISSRRFTDRFEREARSIAALNHPNVCTLYDVGPDYLVMELIDGVTLSERIARGPVPVEEALAIARQIADALEAAHEKGIVHRDLKPANIKIRRDGSVKVLDFGLAKSTEPTALSSDSPTMLSTVGMILGTAGYMAPEQARGLEVDARADIWAFGVVLYEMITGRRLFVGGTIPDTLVAVITRDPDLRDVPVHVQRLLRACLRKDLKSRLQAIGDAKLLLDGESESVVQPAPPTVPASAMARNAGWMAAALVTVATGALAFAHFRETPAEMPAVRASVLPPEKTAYGFDVAPYGAPALSPDGHRVVFGAQSPDGTAQLWVRALDSATAQPLAGTEVASFGYPFWSPDGRYVAFGGAGKLMRVDLAGGPPVTLTDAPNFRGASWSPRGTIVFTPNSVGPLQRIPEAGGAAVPATALDPARKETSHRWPWFLPDGRHFLYVSVVSNTNDATLYLGSLDSPEARKLTETNSNAIYASGYLLFLRQNTLMAQRFDPKRLAVMEDAIPVASQIADNSGNAVGFFTASERGTLLFQLGGQATQTLTWLDRAGKRLTTLGEPGLLSRIHISPDGKYAAVSALDRTTRNNDLWLHDLTRNLRTRFTFDAASELEGVWSPDGSRVAFSSNRKGHFDIYVKSATGTGAEELLYADGLSKYPTGWSRDGKSILYYSTGDPKTGYDLWALPVAGDRKPVPFLKTGFNELLAQFSPDGRSVAYTSDESGRYEVYVAAFPGPGGRRQVSAAGGFVPRWRADGKELFYVALDGRLMAVELTVKASGVEFGAVHPLFGPLPSNGYQYDVSADGQRILAVMPNGQAAPEPLTLMQNWVAGLKK